jgi:GT2 family glycosyltransferase
MPRIQPLVSVVILNWNRPLDTVKCVESVKAQSYTNKEIIVIDNGSVDNSLDILKQISNIKLVINTSNRGFTGGHIDGLKHTKGEYIFVLNNDAVVDKDYIKNAIEILKTDEKIAVIGGRSYQWELEEHIFDENVPFFAFQKINRKTMEGIFERSDSGHTHETNWVSGSAMIIRKSAIDKVGYLFEPMFAYYEECDLFARMQAHDFKIVYSPSLKIWHKNGASSSSLFQLRQLFKNRFTYAMRNLEPRELIDFITAYSKTTIRGAYYHLLRKSSDKDSETTNLALYSALKHSLTSWPKWASSRKGIIRRDSRGYTLKDRLKIEQTGVSFICDLSDNIKNIRRLADFIKTTTYAHYESEIIVVCQTQQYRTLLTLITKEGLANLNVRVVTDRGFSRSHPINLGWLSASKKYIWFIDSHEIPAIDTIEHVCLKIPDHEFGMYVESPINTKKSVSTKTQLTDNTCLSRNILSLYGGIDSSNLRLSLARLHYFAKALRPLDIHTESVKPSDTTINYATEKQVIHKVRLLIHDFNNQNKKRNKYNKLLEKYYRLYQLNNISRWLFIKEIPIRLKLARIKNCAQSTLLFNRKKLATELKHISNEVIKTKHSGFDRELRESELKITADHQINTGEWKNTPVFVICRDRLSPLKALVDWLQKAGMRNIYFIDNASIYPPLLEYLSSTAYQVIYTNKNIGHTVVWKEGFAKTLFPGQYYIVTDPDVIPNEKAPLDSVKYFYGLHKKYLDYQKVGFGLQIHDLPDNYNLKTHVIEWESQFWKHKLEEGVFEAGIDTTFALYKPYTDNYCLNPSIRTGAPYTAKHLPWYCNSSKIDYEEQFYRLHASQAITSWNADALMDRYLKEMR